MSRQFGPYMNRAVLPDDVLDAMIKMSDDIIGDKTTESHGQSLAGIIEKELRLYKSNMIEYGVDKDADMIQSCRKLEDGENEDEDVVKMIVNNGKILHMVRKSDILCDNIIIQLGLYLYRRDVIVDFPNCDMTFVKSWKGLDTIGFCGKYNVYPFDLKCGKVRAVDRPHHIDEIESQLFN